MKPVSGNRSKHECGVKVKVLTDKKASETDELEKLKEIFSADSYNIFISSVAPETMGGEYRLNKCIDSQKVEARNIYPVSYADFSFNSDNEQKADEQKTDEQTNKMVERVSNRLKDSGKYLYFSAFDEASSSEQTSEKIRHRLQFIPNDLKSTLLGEDKIKDISDKERCTLDSFYSILQSRNLEASILSTADRSELLASKSDAPSQGPSESPSSSEHPLPPPPPPPLPPPAFSERLTKNTISSKSTEMSDLSLLDENIWFNPKKALKEDGADADASKPFEYQKTYLKERYTNFYKKMNNFKKALDETKGQGDAILNDIFKCKMGEYTKIGDEIKAYQLRVDRFNKE